MDNRYQSWGRYPRAQHTVWRLSARPARLSVPKPALSVLPFGNGRSYGDSCLNDGGQLLDVRGLDRFIHFDPIGGVVRCEAGVLLAEILELVVSQGWFLCVTPGTRFVTVGGAIANDVHGKNHHRAGSFGHHVRCFELLRSDGSRRTCSPSENPQWFRATLGGLGLTGLITWAEIGLQRIDNPYIDVESLRFGNLAGFFELSQASDRDYQYTVAWVDCLARGKALGRGLFMRGNHATALCTEHPRVSAHRLNFPIELPVSLVNGWTLQAFNTFYYRKHKARSRKICHYQPFFYPLDAIHAWNRVYGRKGFLQYQCVVPRAAAYAVIHEILNYIAVAGTGSFLTVLKAFGDKPPLGLLSFSRPGVTLALDFSNRGKPTLELLQHLDEVVRVAQGAVYPAKDARMSGESFRSYFPSWIEFSNYIDPTFSSSFWRRVMEKSK